MILPPIGYWLALTRASVGAKKLAFILERQGEDLSRLFSAKPDTLAKLGLSEKHISAIRKPNWKAIEQDVQWAEKENHHIVSLQSPDYPSLLKEISSPPIVLYVKGNLNSLKSTQMAMVGSRRPSHAGEENAYAFAQALAKEGYTLTSGLADGIDGICHQATLRVPGALTIAVLGHGFHTVYPAKHRELAEQISMQGALVTEFPYEQAPKAAHFPRRNRIISGLSVGVLVVEAGIKSGSLITAHCALEQNREIFAIPGSIHHPQAKGCHQLIRQGAKLVEQYTDILEELPPMEVLSTQKQTDRLDKIHQKVINCIDYHMTPVELIAKRCGLAIQNVLSLLTLLEEKGYIHPVAGGYCRQQ